MGGKGGGEQQSFQPQPSTIDTNVKPVDLTQSQEFIDQQRAAAEATAGAQADTLSGQGDQPTDKTSTGDIAAKTLQPPDVFTGQPTGTKPVKKSKLVTTDTNTSSSV